jgi:CHC2 zinc finger
MNENNELHEKIDQAKRRLPLPQLMERLGLASHAKKRARCPFPGHEDKHPSFSAFQGKGGLWHYNCFAGCGEGDEIMFLSKLKALSLTEAISLYLKMAGFPPSRSPKSHEYPESRESREFPRSHESPKSPKYPVSPMSNGQGREKALKALAARRACTEPNSARERLWQLVRDLKAVEKGINRELKVAELVPVFNEWHRLSQAFLDPAKTREDYLASFLASLRKVRVPTGEGETNKKALEAVSKLPVSELPMIAGMPDAPESWRRVAALHREMSRRSGGNTYFLSCRDAANAFPGMSYQGACDLNRALERLGVVKIVRIGDRRPNGKASKFRYLLSQTEDGAPQAEKGRHTSKDGEGQNANERAYVVINTEGGKICRETQTGQHPGT